MLLYAPRTTPVSTRLYGWDWSTTVPEPLTAFASHSRESWSQKDVDAGPAAVLDSPLGPDQGRRKETEELNAQVMEKRKMVLGEKHPDALTSCIIWHVTGYTPLDGGWVRWGVVSHSLFAMPTNLPLSAVTPFELPTQRVLTLILSRWHSSLSSLPCQ
jgi:hypothetical protein